MSVGQKALLVVCSPALLAYAVLVGVYMAFLAQILVAWAIISERVLGFNGQERPDGHHFYVTDERWPRPVKPGTRTWYEDAMDVRPRFYAHWLKKQRRGRGGR